MADGLPLDTESMASGDPGAIGALDAGKQTLTPEIAKVSTPEEYEKVLHGGVYMDPQGQKRFKPVRNKSDYESVAEGAEYADPTGSIRTKPKYEGIDFTPQTLYDIAHSDKGRKMALEKFYPGKVKEDVNGELYIDDGGKLLKPGRGASKIGGAIASEAIPTVLAGAGGLIGGAAGSALEPGGGTVLGGAAGGYAGGYSGQRINDIFSQLAGVYDPEGGEANARMSGYAGAAGDVGGRAISAAAPAIKEGAQFVGRNASKAAGKFLGVNAEKLETGLPIAEAGEQAGAGPMGLSKPGTAVSPSAIFESSPHLTNVAEILQQKFDKSDTYLANAEKFMDKRAKEVLASKDIGALVEGSLVHPKAAVPTEEAGSVIKESARLRAINESAEADQQLAEVLANRKAAVEAKHAPDIEAHRTRNESVVRTAEQAKTAADNLVQQGFQHIERQANDAVRVAQVGHNAGDLWRTVAESFVNLRRSIGARANQMYTNAETASGGLVPPGANELAGPARELIGELPEGFDGMHPSIVRRLRDIAGEVDAEGNVVREPADATWVQLHNLRSQIRQDIKWNDLPSDIKNGTLKFLNNKINEVLHPVEEGSVESPLRKAEPTLPDNAADTALWKAGKISMAEWEARLEKAYRPLQTVPPTSMQTPPGDPIKNASRLLKLADAFYRENMGPLNDHQIKSLVKALDSGLQADPKALLKVAIRDGKTEVANTIRNTVGPQTWDAMRAADVQDMLSSSRLLDSSIDGSAFAKQVQDRFQNGVLNVLHGEAGGARLIQQAKYIQQLKGKLPIQPRPGDTANDIILRARSAAADAENLAKADPLKAMTNEMKKVEAAAKKEFAANRKPDPLAFLTNSTVGANEAVNRILKDPDLIVAASRAFPGGEKSAEFQLMRQIWTQRFLSETLEPGEKLAATSPEIQALMFPGVTLDDMHMLAKEMKLLMSGATMRGGGGDMGGSIMAQSAVENPFGRASGLGKLAGPMKILPGANFGARAALTAYYNGVRGLLTSPSTLRWLRKGLTSRDPQAKEAARAELRAHLQRGGAMGASAGENAYQGSND
jgi:hypothetical protein